MVKLQLLSPRQHPVMIDIKVVMATCGTMSLELSTVMLQCMFTMTVNLTWKLLWQPVVPWRWSSPHRAATTVTDGSDD